MLYCNYLLRYVSHTGLRFLRDKDSYSSLYSQQLEYHQPYREVVTSEPGTVFQVNSEA